MKKVEGVRVNEPILMACLMRRLCGLEKDSYIFSIEEVEQAAQYTTVIGVDEIDQTFTLTLKKKPKKRNR